MSDTTFLYDDGRIACSDSVLEIRWYYLWGPKRIPYATIRSIDARPLTGWRGRWRIWGSGDLTHWYNLDPNRPNKQTAIEINTGGRIRPTITPDDPEAVVKLLTDQLSQQGRPNGTF